MTVKTFNPTTEQMLSEYETMTKEKVDKAVSKAGKAFKEWKTSADKRADHIYQVAQVFLE
jgi:acyl-CoA reductase-like NAD-dependent aldehyde dehydrogenase